MDLFTSPKEQDSILSTQDVRYPPTNALDNTGPVIFNIPAVDDELSDLSKFSLATTVQVRRSDEANIGEASTDQVQVLTNTDDSESGEEDRDLSSSSTPEVSIPNDFGNLDDFAIQSQFGKHPLVRYPSRRWPGITLDFSYHSGPTMTGSTFFRCKKCKGLKNREPRNHGSVPSMTARDGIIMTDPDYPSNDHYCHGMLYSSLFLFSLYFSQTSTDSIIGGTGIHWYPLATLEQKSACTTLEPTTSKTTLKIETTMILIPIREYEQLLQKTIAASKTPPE